jgi:PhzF family phenazine biosynthesis protein
MIRRFKQVDVFTNAPFLGNPVAVVLDASGMDDQAMQRFANWTNLSETTFVTPSDHPNADYAVRIFTPRAELPFAGHPTLGTAHAVIEAGIARPRGGKVVQQCAVGLVAVSQEEDRLSFRLPRYAASAAPEGIGRAIGGDALLRAAPQILDVGPRWVIAELVSAEAVEQLTPDLAALAAYDRTHGTTGLTVFAQGGAGDITVRSFAPADGIAEDPVCGSGNGAVAAYRLLSAQVADGTRYLATQGRQVGRDGKVHVRIEGSDIHVSGGCVTCLDGTAAI